MGETITKNDITYEYVRYNNRWTIHSHAYVDNQISKLVAQDPLKEFAFVVTYQETLTSCDAKICIFQPGLKGSLIPFGCVQASALANLDNFRPDKCYYNELTNIQKRRYFVEDYIVEGYIDPMI